MKIKGKKEEEREWDLGKTWPRGHCKINSLNGQK